jgi:hypothetical protein
MNLSDREILELNELCGAVVDGRATEAQRVRLEQWLGESEAARRYYVRALGQSASLHAYAAEMHADAPPARARRRQWLRIPAWATFTALAAAAIAVGVFVFSDGTKGFRGPAATRGDFVARLTAEKGAQWKRGTAALTPGAALRKGQQLELESGFAEITFDSGARVVLEGAASLAIISAWDAALRHGTLRADVPPQAMGFRVTNRFVDVIDLGTEFTMIAEGDRGAEVLVNKGEVEAAPRSSGESETILLREKESRRFAATGVSQIDDHVRKFARFDEPLDLQRFVSTGRFVHWSFDEPRGAAAGHGALAAAEGAPMRLLGTSEAGESSSRSEGRRERALRFDGQRYASAPVPGVSGAMPRTVAFWVKVPPDAQPLDTWMVAWGTQLPKLGRRPVHIGWNRRPAEGALGALRTDFGGGHAIGTTNLRDGNWHHVVVFFAPGAESDSPVQVKQYVDGRLESSTIVRGTLSAREGTGDAAIADTVWLGYRLTGNRQEGRRFLGELDELFIIDRALQPHEVVALMNDNRLPDPTLAAHP